MIPYFQEEAALVGGGAQGQALFPGLVAGVADVFSGALVWSRCEQRQKETLMTQKLTKAEGHKDRKGQSKTIEAVFQSSQGIKSYGGHIRDRRRSALLCCQGYPAPKLQNRTEMCRV